MATFTVMTELEQLVCAHKHIHPKNAYYSQAAHLHRIMYQTDLENRKAIIILCRLYKELKGM